MKTQIGKNTKRVLSFVLAFALVLGSVFVANSGVTFKADAESTTPIELTWNGTVATALSDTTHGGTSWDDAIIISTPEELAYLAKGAGDTTKGKYYKIADGIKAFNMNGMTGIDVNSTAEQVKSATATGKNWSATVNNSQPFRGLFDGNGIVIYNLYHNGSWAAGLFPCIGTTQTDDIKTTFKNITITASYFKANSGVYTFGAGAIFGAHINDSNKQKILVENCAVVNNFVQGAKQTNDTACTRFGAIGGSVPWVTTNIKNCLVKDNLFVDDTGATATTGLVGERGGSVDVTNTLVIGNPVNSSKANQYDYFGRVYATDTTSVTGVTVVTTSDITGVAAKTKLTGFDFDSIWWATTNIPELRITHKYHNFTTTMVDENCHSEKCVDCDFVGADNAKHVFVDYHETKTSVCACGANGVYVDIWDGTAATSFASGKGTEKDPYIIKTPEQLYKMVSDQGINAEGTPCYYKVADGVNVLYLNDTRTFTAAGDMVSAASSLNNWSKDLKLSVANQNDQTGNRYSQYFAGYFDGNGVTISGLYSKTPIESYNDAFLPGVGFVSSMVDNAVIKNVDFDYAYVTSNGAVAAVVTASFGNNNWDKTALNQKFYYNTNASIGNITVKNSYVSANGSVKYGETDTVTHSAVAGIVATRAIDGGAVNIANCLFDGTTSTLVNTAATDNVTAGIYSAMSYGDSTKLFISSSVSVGKEIRANAKDNSGNTVNYSMTVTNSYKANTLSDITVENMPLLSWGVFTADDNGVLKGINPTSGWEVKKATYYKDAIYNSQKYIYKDGTMVPVGSYGVGDGTGAYEDGEYNRWYALEGNGTEADPYIINDALTLYRIIAAGGMNLDVPQYFKLGCDINLDGVQWCTTETVKNSADTIIYKYDAFKGTLDGNGHTISGLYSIVDSGSLGFIPVMAGGTIKNIRFADAYVKSTSAQKGIIVGSGTGTVEGCSVIDQIGSVAIANGVTVKNCYSGNTYYDENGNTTTPIVDFTGKNFEKATWYAGSSGVPHLLSQALQMPCADVDGDGEGYEYTTNDVVALKNRLTRTSGYANVYGDTNRNGITDIRDLVYLQKQIAQVEVHRYDGFWANLKAGKFTIYYSENDTYDFARKLELYFAETADIAVPKTKSTAPDNYAIVLKKDSTLGETYKVEYDLENAVLTFTGGSFTAVEQAVLDFIAKADATKGTVPAIADTLANTDKASVTVYGDKYYYAWGDEFDTPTTVNGNSTVNYGNWTVRDKFQTSYKGEKSGDVAPYMQNYLRNATREEATQLNTVQDGKLILKRGYANNEFYQSGLSSKNSMLFKRGYVEAMLTLPVDGFSFASLWLNASPGNNNRDVDTSLYGKVYEKNTFWNNKIYYTPTEMASYQYKLPQVYAEFDIVEIIQKPDTKYFWSQSATGSNNKNIYFATHQWYRYGYDTDTKKSYLLDWDSVTSASSTFAANSKLDGIDSKDIIAVNKNYNKYYGQNYDNYSDQKLLQYVDTAKINNKSYVKMKVGLIWNEDNIIFAGWDTAGNNLYYKVVSMQDYKAMATGYGVTYEDQYSYLLLENNLFTTSSDGKTSTTDDAKNATMEVDYVRVYQLDGQRDIVTAETEAFNNNNRWSANIYN